MWVAFIVVFLVLMVVDLGVVDKGAKKINTKKAARMVLLYISVALIFGLLVYYEMGSDLAASYYAAYVIELSMSVDNLFVFIVIFAAFMVPDEDQHRVLFWGIMGAIFFRAAFILVGAELLNRFEWMMYIFGVVLIYTAYRTALKKDSNKKEEDGIAYKLSKHIPATSEIHGPKFFIKENGKRLATPLFLCLVVIELSDLMFAFDSIPAALAISTDIFVIYASNIFAVMGLRSMYFVIRNAIGSMYYLKYGLGVILCFIGLKMILGAANVLEIGVVESLLFIISVLTVTIVASLIYFKRHGGKNPQDMEALMEKHSAEEKQNRR